MENIKWKAVELSTPQYPDGAVIIKEDTEIEYPLAIVPFPGEHENGTKMQRKRAKLIAAAPELLESLNELFSLLEEHQPEWYLRGHYKRAHVAISKATGK